MPVTDDQEATLHAQLAGRFEEHKRLLDGLDPVAARTGYNALVMAAFALAADRRFPDGTTEADVITWVGDIRSRTEGAAAAINPRLAERLILAFLAVKEPADIDPRTKFQTRLLLLAGLIAEADPDPDSLARFMAQARRLADKWLSRPD
jgi:hypothetical protein